jgi:hypothetical protein
MDAIGHRGDCGKANEASTVGLRHKASSKIDPVVVNVPFILRGGMLTLFLSLWASTENEQSRKLDRRLCVERGPTNEVHVFPLPSLSTCSSRIRRRADDCHDSARRFSFSSEV